MKYEIGKNVATACKIVAKCILRGSPFITVTMGDSVESGVENSIIPSLPWDGVDAVVVLTATSVCLHKGP